MKRKIFLIAIIFMSIQITLCSCGIREEESNIDAYKDFEIKKAENVFDNYIQALTKNDYEKAKSYFSQDLLKNYRDESDKTLVVTGGVIESKNKISDYGVLKAKITSSNMAKPYCCLDENIFKIVKEGNEYKIAEISSKNIAEAFLEGNKIRYRKNGDIHDFLLLRKDSIPKYGFSATDKNKTGRMIVPINNYGNINFSYDGDIMTFSTFYDNSYVSIVRIDQSLAVQGKEADGTGEQPDAKTSDVAIEKPIGKEINTLDILKESMVEKTMFSQDQQYVAVQYETKDKQKGIRIYNIDNYNMISYSFEDNFKTDDINLTIDKFENNKFYFSATFKTDAKNKETYKELAGYWQLDLKNFKAKKIYKSSDS